MKILQNPVVVGILVMVAGVVVCLQLWPMVHRETDRPRTDRNGFITRLVYQRLIPAVACQSAGR